MVKHLSLGKSTQAVSSNKKTNSYGLEETCVKCKVTYRDTEESQLKETESKAGKMTAQHCSCGTLVQFPACDSKQSVSSVPGDLIPLLASMSTRHASHADIYAGKTVIHIN